MADLDRLNYLWQQYTGHDISFQEYEELFALIREGVADEQLQHWLAGIWEELEPGEAIPGVDWDQQFRQITQRSERPAKTFRLSWRSAAMWTGLLVMSGLGVYIYNRGGTKPEAGVTVAVKRADLPPGGNRAILTLSGGRRIILDSVQPGDLAQQGGVQISKTDSGKLSYHSIPKLQDQASAILYNTLSTPRGGQYQLTLPDGTKVWLNAASSITYPTGFTGNTRTVQMTGEVYIEIAKNAVQPFIVRTGGVDIQVMGTSFNVNAYEDEPSLQTTLVTGSVKVKFSGDGIILKPGQQAIVVSAGQQQKGQGIKIQPADIEQTLAWKNGSFYLKHTPLAEALRQISRWYDVDVVYEKGIPAIFLGGEIKRDLSLSQMLDGLGAMGVSFRIEKKRLIVVNGQPEK